MLSNTFSLAAAAAALLPSAIASPVSYPILPRQELEQPSINASLPNVTIFATGGTIASQGTSSAQTVGYQVGLGVQQLVDAVPEILNISNIYGQQIANVGSQNINSSVLLSLARNITEELEKDDVSGVVVTHGTDTLEETAFYLDLVLNSTKPVVVVGAMRPATALSADGPLNLYQAVSLAASEKARGRGVMIALNDRIGNPFYTTKNNANSLDTFFATEQGQLGFFINQVPYFFYTSSAVPNKPFFPPSPNATTLPTVSIIYTHQDDVAALVPAAVEAGARGLVFAGSGAGSIDDAVKEAAGRVFNETSIPMIASRRTVDGFVPKEDVEDYMVAGGWLNPQKARILLQVAVDARYGVDEIRGVFDGLHP
ncbi:putative l-asparaginase protein [Botryosphaeria dothidea]|uniref:asparaginase n=1 Tax=Botryosphaeria dothidea TaxID=55169 RepID=A0A8H4IQ72_9PEZI|nr:putative l-asparaginase protein [Botryosphaeria dothidea]